MLNHEGLVPPRNPLSARFGWAVTQPAEQGRDHVQQNVSNDRAVWAHMCSVVSKVWEAVNV